MDSSIHNLDDGVKESFDFKVGGHTYTFTHPNTEQIYEIQKVKDEEKVADALAEFIEPKSKDAPPFKEMYKKMIAPQWKNFKKMIQVEVAGINA